MTYYIHIENNQIFSSGECPMGEPFRSIEVSEELYNDFVQNPDKYMWNGKEIVLNPDYEEIEKQKEREKQRRLLLEQIDELDKKRIRAVCEPSIKDETTGETWLDYYNSEIQKLREQLKNL